jgi:hypothetical protein
LLIAGVVPECARTRNGDVQVVGIIQTILGWLRRPREEDEETADIDTRPGRRSSDKEDIRVAERYGTKFLDFEDGQSKPRH